MNSPELLQPLQALLACAQGLLARVATDTWELLEPGIQDYQQQLGLLGDPQYLQALQAAGLAESAQAMIAQIQPLHLALEAYASQECAQVASELRQLSRAHKAMNAYGQ
jgi:hypothetical protein